MPHRFRSLLRLVVVGLLTVMGVAVPASAAVQGRVAVVGVPGLEWSDIDQTRTPNLWKLAGQGGTASLSTRAVPPPGRGITCAVAGWLTVSAGQRAGTPGEGCPETPAPQRADDQGSPEDPGTATPESPAPTDTSQGPTPRPTGTPAPAPTGDPGAPGHSVTVPGWAELVAHQAGTGYDARLGTLAQTVIDGGGKVAAVGPGAALAAADEAGRVETYADAPARLGDLSSYALIVMDVPDLATAWAAQPRDEYGVPTGMPQDVRQEAAAAADRRVGEFLAVLPKDTTVLVAGISDVSPGAHLHVAMATGERYPAGHLTATSTRQDALVAIQDLTATAIHLTGLEPPRQVVGRPWQPGGATGRSTQETVAELADADLASQVLREVRGPFFAVFVAVQLLFYAFAALALRRRRSAAPPDARGAGAGDTAAEAGGAGGIDVAGASRLLVTVQVVSVMSGGIAVATFLAQLVPWWSLPAPMAALIVTIVAMAGLITGLAFAGPWRAHVLGPLTVVALVTSVAMLGDVMTGSHLQVNAVSGYEPVTGGRFYGFSNIAFAIYATGTVLGLAGIAQWLRGKGAPRAAVMTVCVLYGGLAVFADGSPAWGADFGGVPAFVAGLSVFLILLSGGRVSFVKLLVVGLVGAVLIGAISVADWARPAGQRTHLGTFVQQVIDGQAWTVVSRKFGAMVGVTVGNWSLTLLSLVALAFLFLVLARPSRWGASALGQAYAHAPALRAGLIGALTCAFIGFLMNDSGIAIPAMALTVAVPLTLASCVRALQLATPTTAGQPSAPAAATERPDSARRS
ncbi:hypothetical protein [Nonomuraea harbinensis]|uniref:Uncharacterized protein n=1 Tax=Nonomuraea harbinensis TaxID=1286938 RepID=A0ABW1C784_9ACTN|nr:hypothetical protein [Nonomuraea harbinensis]